MNKCTSYDSFLSLSVDYTLCKSVLPGHLGEEEFLLILTLLGREKEEILSLQHKVFGSMLPISVLISVLAQNSV